MWLQVSTDATEGFLLQPELPGVIMAENYIRLATMAGICSTLEGATIPHLLTVISRREQGRVLCPNAELKPDENNFQPPPPLV